METENFTHTYKNSLGGELKCFIWDPSKEVLEYKTKNLSDFDVRVTNENGAGVFLKYSVLTKIYPNDSAASTNK